MSFDKDQKRRTKLVHLGRKPEDYYGVVNPPLVRTSTILYDNLAAYLDPHTRFRYGRINNPLSETFEKAMVELEGGYGAISTCSGLAAITTAMQSFAKVGDHVLVVDSCYAPARYYCQRQLAKMGVDVEFFDPFIAEGIAELIRPNTAFIYMESPCSVTFEVMDIPAIVAAAKARNVLTIIDNTWAGGILCNPMKLGVNIVLQSCAKYIGGHSDVNLGFVAADTQERYKRLKETAVDLGQCAAGEDMILALRGLRTLEMRMKQAQGNMLPIMRWFQSREEVQEVFCPMLETHRGHSIWKRDFTGHNGLFSVMFKPEYKMKVIEKFIDSLKLFPIGSSWGGYESLIQPQNLRVHRMKWDGEGFVLRFQIGHEDTQDLIADLEQAITHLKIKKGLLWF